MLNRHFNNRHKKDFYCDFCDQKFTTSRGLQSHVENLHTFINGKALQKCRNCTFTCEDPFTMQVHKAKHRQKYFGPFICENCDKKFKNHESLRDHLKKKTCKRSKEEVVLYFFWIKEFQKFFESNLKSNPCRAFFMYTK